MPGGTLPIHLDVPDDYKSLHLLLDGTYPRRIAAVSVAKGEKEIGWAIDDNLEGEKLRYAEQWRQKAIWKITLELWNEARTEGDHPGPCL